MGEGVSDDEARLFAVGLEPLAGRLAAGVERQRRLDNMTEEERAQFFANGGAILMPHEDERLNREKQEKEGIVKKSKQ